MLNLTMQEFRRLSKSAQLAVGSLIQGYLDYLYVHGISPSEAWRTVLPGMQGDVW
jgi:hypothetical protein